MDTTNHKQLQSLLAIIDTSNRIGPISLSTLTPVPANHPTLPRPPDVLPELEATGVPASMITELLHWYNKGCRSIRQRTEAALANLPITSPRIFHVFENAYLKRINDLKDLMLQRVSNTSNKKPPKFNQVCFYQFKFVSASF